MARNSKVGILITGDSKGAVKAVNLTSDSLKDLEKTHAKGSKGHDKYSKSMAASFNDMAKKAAAWSTAAVAAGAAVTASLVKAGLASVDSLAKTSDKLGVTTEALAGLRYAADLTGVSQNKLDVALQRMTRRMADAAEGAGPAVKAFDALGLSADELIKLSPDEAFTKIATEMNKVENQSKKVSLAFKLFDSEGVDLVRTAALGADGLAAMREEAEILGLTLSRVDAAKVEAANDAMGRIGKSIDGLGQQLAVKVAPLLQGVADEFFEIAKEAGGMGEVATEAFSMIMKAAGFVGDAFAGIARLSTTIGVAAIEGAKLAIKGLDAIARFVTSTPPVWLAMKLLGIVTGDDYSYSNSAIAKYVDALEVDMGAAADYIASVWQEPIPSDQIERFTANVTRSYKEMEVAATTSVGEIAGEVETAETATKALATATQDTAVQVTAATETITRDWSGARATLSDFFFEIASTGATAWETLYDGFKAMLAKMVAEAAANTIIISIGTAFAGAGVSTAASAAGGAVSGATGGGLSGAFSALSAGGLSAISGAYQGFGNLLLDAGVNVGGAYTAKGAGLLGGGGWLEVGKDLGAGLIGALAAREVFGSTSGIGATAGGFLGAAGGPLGAGAGSFIGAGLEKALSNVFGFGSSKPGQNAGYAEFNLGTGQLDSGGYGKSYNAENVSFAEQLVIGLQDFAAIIGGSSFAGQVDVGDRSGIKYGGVKYGEDTEAFFKAAFDDILREAETLTPALRELIRAFEGTAEQTVALAGALVSIDQLRGINTVTQAIEDFTAVQPSLQQAYIDNTSELASLIHNYDGTASAAVELNNALQINKAAAYEFAMAIQAAGQALADRAAQQAQDIRQSVLTEDQLRAERRAERNELRERLPTITNAQEIERVTSRILDLNKLLFDTLSEDLKLDRADSFATYAENTAQVAQTLLERSLDALALSQEEMNRGVSIMLNSAAAQQQQAANTQLDAAAAFGQWVQRLQSQGITVRVDTGSEVNV